MNSLNVERMDEREGSGAQIGKREPSQWPSTFPLK